MSRQLVAGALTLWAWEAMNSRIRRISAGCTEEAARKGNAAMVTHREILELLTEKTDN